MPNTWETTHRSEFVPKQLPSRKPAAGPGPRVRVPWMGSGTTYTSSFDPKVGALVISDDLLWSKGQGLGAGIRITNCALLQHCTLPLWKGPQSTFDHKQQFTSFCNYFLLLSAIKSS